MILWLKPGEYGGSINASGAVHAYGGVTYIYGENGDVIDIKQLTSSTEFQVVLDLTIRFDQAAFDAEYGPNSFPLDEYYKLSFSPNIPTVPVCDCDLNHDGRCNMRDWLIFGQDWGRTDCPMP